MWEQDDRRVKSGSKEPATASLNKLTNGTDDKPGVTVTIRGIKVYFLFSVAGFMLGVCFTLLGLLSIHTFMLGILNFMEPQLPPGPPCIQDLLALGST